MDARTEQQTERKIGLGWTEDGYRVVAILRLEQPERSVTTLIDHSTTETAPLRLSILWDLVKGRQDYQGGQVDASDRVIVRRHQGDASPELDAYLTQIHLDHHLNDLNAGCVHMTPEMLTPKGYVLAEYESTKRAERGEWREQYSPAFYGPADVLQSWRLDNVACPETGYRWGHAWLAYHLPDDVISTVRHIIETGSLS